MKKTVARTTLIMAFIAAFGILSLSARADIEHEMINVEGKIAAAMFNYLDTEIERSQALLELELTKVDSQQSDIVEGKILATLLAQINSMITKAGADLEEAYDLEALDKVQEDITLINRLIGEINR